MGEPTLNDMCPLLRHLAAKSERGTGRPLTDAACARLAEQYAILAPNDVIDLLSCINGAIVGTGVVLLGCDPGDEYYDAAMWLDAFPWFAENKWLPLANDGCGNLYVAVVGASVDNRTPVAFVDTADVKSLSFVCASSVTRFIRFVLMSEAGVRKWPFHKSFVMEHDPDLASLQFAPLPWHGEDASSDSNDDDLDLW